MSLTRAREGGTTGVSAVAGVTVEMRECEISAVLCEHIEGRSLNRTAPATLERVFVRTQFRK